jgi:monoamine oxidase
VGVNERVWRKQGYTGYAFSDNAMTNGYDHTQMQNNNDGQGGYTIFLGGKAGVDCGDIPMEELQKKYVPALDQIFSRHQSTVQRQFPEMALAFVSLFESQLCFI